MSLTAGETETTDQLGRQHGQAWFVNVTTETEKKCQATRNKYGFQEEFDPFTSPAAHETTATSLRFSHIQQPPAEEQYHDVPLNSTASK